MKSTLRLVAGLLALVLFALPGRAQNVWIVAADGSGDFTDLQTAVGAAMDGDTLVMRAGFYTCCPVTIDGKGLSIVAAVGIVNLPRLTIRNIGVGQEFLLRGNIDSIFRDITVEDSPGTVWLESIRRLSDNSLVVRNSGDVVVMDSVFREGASTVVDSRLHAYRSTFRGRQGNEAFWDDCEFCDYYSADDGRPGLGLDNSQVFLGGCIIRGGNGANASDGNPVFGDCQICADLFGLLPGSDGAPAIVLANGSSLTLNDSQLAGGVHGETGVQKPSVEGGTPTDLGGSVPDFHVSHLVNSGTNATLTFTGSPGNLVLLQLTTNPTPVLLPLLGGCWLTPSGPRARAGTIPASGTLTVDVPVSLPGSVPSFVFYLQAVFIDPAATPGTLSPGSTLVVCNACI